jgi:hypothetical protein
MHARSLVARPFGRSPIAFLLTAICSALSASPFAVAGTIYWNMQTLAPTSSEVAGLLVGELTRGQGGGTSVTGTASSSIGSYSFLLDGTATLASGGSNAQSSALGGSLSTGSSAYFAVTLTNASAFIMTVESIGFGSRSTGTGPTGYALRTSLNGYATDVAGATGSLPTTSTWDYYTNTPTTPLPIAVGSSLELRIYGWGGSAANLNNLIWRIDDLHIVVVPEPGTISVGISSGWMLFLRRRSRLTKRRSSVSPPSRT